MMKAKLQTILKKYPFIHIDTQGELSIILPLTGARTVSTNFTANSESPFSLYLFGDNSCKSDIERTEFFNPQRGTRFDVLFSTLINELDQLLKLQTQPKEKEIIQTIISSLDEQKSEVLQFKRGNPVCKQMQDDLCESRQGFVVKGEFIVTGSEDNVRTLNLPNVLNLINGSAIYQEILQRTHVNEFLNSINSIPNQKPINLGNLLLELINNEGIRACQDSLTQTPAALFKLFYDSLKAHFPALPQQSPGFYQTLVKNLHDLYRANEDYSTYTADDIKEAIKLLFEKTELFGEEFQRNSFSSIFHHAIMEFDEKQNIDRLNTYKLFIVQTFLYLCTLQLRIKNTEHAEKFLLTLQDPGRSKELIEQLCEKETDFISMLNKEYKVSSEEYIALIYSTHQIVLDHIGAPNFDELRVACMALNLTNTHYLVLGGRLCWSTTKISECSNINNIEQQKLRFDEHYDLFYSKAETYTENIKLIRSLQEYLRNVEFEEIALQSLCDNLKNFSLADSEMLLELAISQKQYQCAAYLVSKGIHNKRLFTVALDQNPLNMNLIIQLCAANPGYKRLFTAERLAKALQAPHPELIKFILAQKPNLLEARFSNRCTPLLLACQKGNPELVDYLLSLGADTLAITSGETVLNYVTRQNRNSAISQLFNNYPQRVRELLASNQSLPFLTGPEYLLKAIQNEQHQLVEVLLEYYPTWIDAITGQDLINAVSAQSLPAVQTILRLKPEVLNAPDKNQRTAFFHACKINNFNIIKYLMNAGANIFQTDSQGQSPQNALQKTSPQTSTLSLFISYYEQMEPSSVHYQDIFNSNNFRTAVLNNDQKLVHCILQKHPEFINEITGADLFKAIRNSHFEGVKFILDHKVDLLEYKDPSNKTPFFYACENKNLKIATYLAQAGANIHAGEIISREPSAKSYSGHTLLRAKDLNLTSSLKELLCNYHQLLKSNSFQKINRITENHILDAIDARDLTCVDHLLILRPDLKATLGKNNLLHIEQQRVQNKLNTQYLNLLVELEIKSKEFPHSVEANSPYQIMNSLLRNLKTAGTQFFNTHISERSITQFSTTCNAAIKSATPVLSTHRGWHGFPLFVKAILGVIAGALVIPALVVSTTTPKGYLGTFFKSPETDSIQRLKKFSSSVDMISTELSNTIQVN